MSHTVVHVMRHGEVHNPQGVLYGRMRGFPLTDLGQEMAQAGTDYLQYLQADIKAVIASPLLRAQQTALPTAKAYGLQVQSDARLIEAANSFEGEIVHANPLKLAHPKFWKRYLNPLRPSWGEPYSQQLERMRSALADALQKYEGGEVLLVSHQLPIWVLRSFTEGRPLVHDPRQRECALGSITSFLFKNHTLLGIEYVEPSADLLTQATDMTPGQSSAEVNQGS